MINRVNHDSGGTYVAGQGKGEGRGEEKRGKEKVRGPKENLAGGAEFLVTPLIVTLNSKELRWVKSVRYLGIYIVSSFKFKCEFDNAKKSFYRSFNAMDALVKAHLKKLFYF